ncbi:hypothetical protein ACIPRD_13640 [Streptomyces sp. NPDC090108]|uniref:hypothetical protein n=1 Tax=Streptomyces sp. NPDC090108 TaxID=3365947 RepID=UPI00382B7745
MRAGNGAAPAAPTAAHCARRARALLSQVPRSAQPWVATLLRMVSEQRDTDTDTDTEGRETVTVGKESRHFAWSGREGCSRCSL